MICIQLDRYCGTQMWLQYLIIPLLITPLERKWTEENKIRLITVKRKNAPVEHLCTVILRLVNHHTSVNINVFNTSYKVNKVLHSRAFLIIQWHVTSGQRMHSTSQYVLSAVNIFSLKTAHIWFHLIETVRNYCTF